MKNLLDPGVGNHLVAAALVFIISLFCPPPLFSFLSGVVVAWIASAITMRRYWGQR